LLLTALANGLSRRHDILDSEGADGYPEQTGILNPRLPVGQYQPAPLAHRSNASVGWSERSGRDNP